LTVMACGSRCASCARARRRFERRPSTVDEPADKASADKAVPIPLVSPNPHERCGTNGKA
jgi:hypothetical protein